MKRMLFAVAALLTAGCAQTEYVRYSDDVVLPDWAEAGPGASDYMANYPDGALADKVAGRAVLLCRLQADRSLQCVVESEEPPGLGFGEAALKVAALYRVRAERAATLSDGPIRVPIRFVPG
jgi:protein TonB